MLIRPTDLSAPAAETLPATATPPSCPACSGSDLRVGPASRATDRSVARCRGCGAHFWAAREGTSAEVIPVAELSPDVVAHWVDIKRPESGPDAWRVATRRLREATADVDAPLLYDIGAGDGSYLALARDEFGFRVSGNEIVAAAVDMAAERNQVDLELGDLSTLGHDGDLDVVTMWCVLAHVPDGDRLLGDIYAALRPGGMLFLQTPRWCAADRTAHQLQRVTRGRLSKLTDRRIARHHSILHTEQSVATQLRRAGFTDVSAEPVARYSLQSRAYLASMNPPPWTLGPASWLMDRAIDSRLAPRIILDGYARKPVAG